LNSLRSNLGIYFFIVLSVVVLFLNGCKQEETDTTDNITQDSEPLEIPPAETFVMNFDTFVDSAARAAKTGGYESLASIQSTSNYNYAAFNVGVWNVVITVGLAVPVATFLESFNHTPVLQSDGTWIWSYSVMIAGINHTAELHGKIVDGEVHWEMYVSKQDVFTDFNWFSGTSYLDGTQGTWTLKKSPDDPSPLLGIEWNRDLQTQTGDIKYTNIVPDGPENGGYIYYGTTSDPTYDAFYDIYNKGADDLIEIEWNRTAKNGRVRNLNHFGNEDWHYWDGSLQDTSAP
jgi:hypothetical protein